jgi:phosphate starvation-inducible PhoH-like protein
MVNLIKRKEVVIAIGSSGTGKTYCALATALNLLGERYKKIVLIKSITTIPQEELGFLPGSAEDKMEPFMMSYTWNIDKLCGKDTCKKLMKEGVVEVLPIAFIRGLSIDNSIVIIDESQNITDHTFKTIMTRIGENSKYIFLGDVEQIDKKNPKDSCLTTMFEIFKETNLIGTIEFADEDCVRNPLIPQILTLLRDNGI